MALLLVSGHSILWYEKPEAWNGAMIAKQELQGPNTHHSHSFVLNFAYAETLELQPDFPAVHTLYANLLTLLREDLEATEARINAEPFSSQESQTSQSAVFDPNGSIATQPANTSESDVRAPGHKRSQELADKLNEYGSVYVVYMRFARRADGEEGARAVFKKARVDKWVPWEVYEAAGECFKSYVCSMYLLFLALLEYHGTKETKVASRIFQLGQKMFGDDVEYISHYLGFLISINDDMSTLLPLLEIVSQLQYLLTDARALFEGVIGTFPQERARPLWEQWARYIYQYGDIAAVLDMEKRIAEAYPGG